MLAVPKAAAADPYRLREELGNAFDHARDDACGQGRFHYSLLVIDPVAELLADEVRGFCPAHPVIWALSDPMGPNLGQEDFERVSPTFWTVWLGCYRRAVNVSPRAFEQIMRVRHFGKRDDPPSASGNTKLRYAPLELPRQAQVDPTNFIADQISESG